MTSDSAGTRKALIVAASVYEDLGLGQLRSPALDAERLVRVFQDPIIGGYSVQVAQDEPSLAVSEVIEEFFAEADFDDLLILYFLCHGVKDPTGRLHFAVSNTRMNRLHSTGISSTFVQERMEESRARRIVLILDCCYSGAFPRGYSPRGGDSVDVAELAGRGRVVITASSAIEYAFETLEPSPTGNPQHSVFTGALVHGLETGAADQDADGLVSVGELYTYVYDQVHGATPHQTPRMFANLEGTLYVARNPRTPQLSTAAFVDWEDLRLLLATGGYTASPSWVLRALIEALSPPPAQAAIARNVGRVHLHMSRTGETLADRRLLAESSDDVDIDLQTPARSEGRTDLLLAFNVADSYHEQPDTPIAIVSDDPLHRYVAQRYASKGEVGRSVELLQARPRPPNAVATGPEAIPDLARRLHLNVGPPLPPRLWTDWDRACWMLRRLARPTSDRIAARLLIPSKGSNHQTWWDATRPTSDGDWQLVDHIDGLVAGLWRLGFGQSITFEMALQWLGNQPFAGSRNDPERILHALMVAQLVRRPDPAHLEVPSSWREGLLFPCRRVVLHLATRRDLSDRRSSVERKHRQTFLTSSKPDSKLTTASISDSLGWVRHALRDELETIVERTDHSALGGSMRWTLEVSPFSTKAISTAKTICTSLSEPTQTGEVLRQGEAVGIAWPGRWLRCLRDVGLVQRGPHGGWSQGPRQLR